MTVCVSAVERLTAASRAWSGPAMKLTRVMFAGVLCLTAGRERSVAAAPPSPAAADDAGCQAVQSPDQRRDAATLRRIERDWLTAELRGDTRFLTCLLLPSYVNIAKDGNTRPGSDIIAHAKRNAGKDRELPPIESTIVVHGDAATAYSRSRTRDQAGQWQDVRFIDSFVFVNGAWHAYAGVDL